MKLISACLLGLPCTWDGADKRNKNAIELAHSEKLIPVCPEQLGGLPTPRIAQEIQDGSGEDVLDGRRRVLNKSGDDVTEEFLRGAEEALKIANQMEIKEFIGRSRSPSCGFGQIYDGSFSGQLAPGNGVTVALLMRNGIRIISSDDI